MNEDDEFDNRTRAMELLRSWRGVDVSVIVQDGHLLIEHRGRLDDYKQNGVFTIRGPGIVLQFVAEIPGAPDRYTVNTTGTTISISPLPGQEGSRLTISRESVL
jgi:hypothetical protein